MTCQHETPCPCYEQGRAESSGLASLITGMLIGGTTVALIAVILTIGVL